MTGNLRKRVARLEDRAEVMSVAATYDLRLLQPEAVDFICQFTFRPPDDHGFIQQLPLIADLLRECEVEPIAPGIRAILPEFPKSLQAYWRHRRFCRDVPHLPQGFYNFRRLTFAEQERFQLLCERYGWEPDSSMVQIDPLSLWEENDVSELLSFLESAISDCDRFLKPLIQ